MPDKKELTITQRTDFGSRPARRLRRAGFIPAVIYGRGADEQNVTLNESEFMDVVGYSTSTGIINLKMGRKSPVTAIVKDVQWDMITDRPINVDFLRVSADQIVTVPVHVHLVNTPAGVLMGGVLEHILHELPIKVRAKDIPSSITVDVAALEIGDAFHISELTLPENLIVDMDPELVIVTVTPPTVISLPEEEEELVEGEEAAEGEETAEGEDASDADASGKSSE